MGKHQPQGSAPDTVHATDQPGLELKVLIIDSDRAVRRLVTNQVEAFAEAVVVGEVGDVAAGQRLAAQHRPDVVLVELPEPPDPALRFAEWLRGQLPEAMVIGNASAARPDLMRLAMRAGAHDLMSRPLDPTELKLALEHAKVRKRERLRQHQVRGHVLAVLGVGGGIGTTTIATNLAVAMAGMEGEGPVVLVDLNLFTGSVPCFLDLQPVRTFRDLHGELDLAGPEGLRQLLPRHGTGVYMLAGPQQIEDLEVVTAAEVGQVIEQCRASFPQVVVDAGHGFDERTVEALDRADRILVVMELNVASLRSARRTAEMLGRLGYGDEKVQIVANRVIRGSRVGLEDAAKILERPVGFSVPNDYPAAITAIDTGVPLVQGKRGSRTAASLLEMARSLAASPAAASNGRPAGGLRRLLGARGRAKSER